MQIERKTNQTQINNKDQNKQSLQQKHINQIGDNHNKQPTDKNIHIQIESNGNNPFHTEQNLTQKNNEIQQREISQYFKKKIIGNSSKFNKKIQLYLQNIIKNIKKDFKNNQLFIEEQKIPFVLKAQPVKQISQQEQLRLKLQKKRQDAIQKIRQIQRQQMNLKTSIVQSNNNLQRSRMKRNSSLIIKPPPETQQQQFKKAILNHRHFLKQIKKRNQLADKLNQDIALKQMQQKQEQIKIRRQSKKIQVIQNLKLLAERQKERKVMIEQWKKKQKQMKQKKYLYIQNSIRQKEEMQIKMNEKNQLLQKLKNAHMFNKAEIQEHERQFNQILQNRKNSIYQSKISHSSSQKKKYLQTKFTQIVKKQLQQLKKKELQKKMKDSQKKDKLQKYHQYVKQSIVPKLHTKQFVQHQRTHSLEPLSSEGLRKEGLKNLQKAKKLKKSSSELKFYLLKKQSEQKLRIAKIKDSYKDYWKQIKKDIKYDPSEKQLNQLLDKNRKRTQSDFEVLAKAKYLTEYMIQKTPVFGDQKTYLTIQKKIDLLQSLY